MELIIDVRGQNACTLWAFYPLIFTIIFNSALRLSKVFKAMSVK